MANIYSVINGVTRKQKTAYTVVGGTTRKITKMYTVVDGVTKLVFDEYSALSKKPIALVYSLSGGNSSTGSTGGNGDLFRYDVNTGETYNLGKSSRWLISGDGNTAIALSYSNCSIAGVSPEELNATLYKYDKETGTFVEKSTRRLNELTYFAVRYNSNSAYCGANFTVDLSYDGSELFFGIYAYDSPDSYADYSVQGELYQYWVGYMRYSIGDSSITEIDDDAVELTCWFDQTSDGTRYNYSSSCAISFRGDDDFSNWVFDTNIIFGNSRWTPYEVKDDPYYANSGYTNAMCVEGERTISNSKNIFCWSSDGKYKLTIGTSGSSKSFTVSYVYNGQSTTLGTITLQFYIDTFVYNPETEVIMVYYRSQTKPQIAAIQLSSTGMTLLGTFSYTGLEALGRYVGTINRSIEYMVATDCIDKATSTSKYATFLWELAKDSNGVITGCNRVNQVSANNTGYSQYRNWHWQYEN